MLDESIRGALPPETGLFKQVTLTFDPWNEHHWIKKRFFDQESPDVLAMTTNYTCNEWLDEADLRLFETMKTQNPRRYHVAGLGEWGIVDGLVYEDWEEKAFSVDEIRGKKGVHAAFGLDFGFTNDPAALFCGLVELATHTIWVFDEMYAKGLTNQQLAKKIKEMGYAKEHIIADCAEEKSIKELQEAGLRRVEPSQKGKDSVMAGVQYVQNFHIIVHPRCVNFLMELSVYTWEKDKKTGKSINKPVDMNNHLMDAMRYGIQSVRKLSSPPSSQAVKGNHQDNYWGRV